jgi:hypothetical protein
MPKCQYPKPRPLIPPALFGEYFVIVDDSGAIVVSELFVSESRATTAAKAMSSGWGSPYEVRKATVTVEAKQ